MTVSPAYRTVTSPESTVALHEIIARAVQACGGKVTRSDANLLESKFGTLLWSRIIGEFWVPNSWLPKRATVRIELREGGGTRVDIEVVDAHKWGIKWGYVGKYEQALQELAARIAAAIPRDLGKSDERWPVN